MAHPDLDILSDDFAEYYAVLNVPRDASDEDIRRAYRTLAQVYHPDKHTDPEQKKKAEQAFNRLQEAYEVLSDPQRRQVYDVYGKEGLAAGFEVGTKLDSVEDLKKKWEEFKKQQEADRAELLSNHRGIYMCRLDLSDPRASLAGQRPLFRAATVTNSIDTPVGESDVFYMQGNAALRANAGAGSLIFGYRRVLSQHDSLDINAVLGPRPSATVTSTRQLTPFTSASVTTSYTVGMGTGMQVSTTRHLPYNMQATLGWVVGPAPMSGISFNISKRGPKYLAAGKLDLGAMTSISARLVYHVTPSVHVRAIARAGAMGLDLELGAGRKWGKNSLGYVGSVIGTQGVSIKGRLVRGGQTFEVPVTLSHQYSDWTALAAAYVAPPLAYIVVSRFVVRPLARWHRQRRERQQQQQHADAIRESLQKAFSERSLIEPVARRKARSEAAKRPAAGLVVLDAVYGKVEAYLAEGGQQQGAAVGAMAVASSADGSGDVAAAMAAAVAGATTPANAAGPTDPDLEDRSGSHATASASGRDTAAASTPGNGATGAATQPPALPPPWLSVTSALQYQVSDSKLTLHPGLSKKNQMGFADPTPGSADSRLLYVAYLYGDKVYEVTVDDMDGLQLPGAGELVSDPAAARGLLHLGAAAHGVMELLQPAAPAATTPRATA
ncbi:molecular chaperone [Volvox carteri f. nagariensis]|uniref:Molecular chaperone n=1 Tax=Volvox carteri f. nagariensis TaxID=3068 RepID=D8U884_VOLCA|nr:molecular chaperone [Volvox carteri f. nagariensis]EFJ44045.1 molecular chaperone [Volvox carteri f. nagariensis]|eukprot:XP_002954846.1 molecular chaperone [Volvox carteri f. nagariensis]